MDCIKLAKEIINGKQLTRQDPLQEFVSADLQELKRGADLIRRELLGDRVDLCTILSGISGRCSENCRFCAQSSHYHTACEEHGLLDTETILQAARTHQIEGVDRFSIVNSGKGPHPDDFEEIIKSFKVLKQELEIGLCASLGFLTGEQFRRLREAGAGRFHCNIETSRRFFPEICTTHSFEEKLENIRRAQDAGLEICSGVIIGMGENWEDRIDMALTLSELGILSIPVNSLMPIPGTPLEATPRLKEEEILRTIAIFRYINPKAHIRLAGGRALMADNGRECFAAGASAGITGNMLTTSASTTAGDRQMLRELGRILNPDQGHPQKKGGEDPSLIGHQQAH